MSDVLATCLSSVTGIALFMQVDGVASGLRKRHARHLGGTPISGAQTAGNGKCGAASAVGGFNQRGGGWGAFTGPLKKSRIENPRPGALRRPVAAAACQGRGPGLAIVFCVWQTPSPGGRIASIAPGTHPVLATWISEAIFKEQFKCY